MNIADFYSRLLRCLVSRFAATCLAIGLVLFVASAQARADVWLPKIFGADMVLQRDKPVPVWGWADPGEKVTVNFAGQTKSATADGQGAWRITLDPMPVDKAGRALTVTGKNSVVMQNVLVGDVWLVSGDFGVFYELFAAAQAQKETSDANYPNLRLIKVTGRNSNTPMPDFDGQWRVCSPASASGFSALGYFFGRDIHVKSDVPIGVIDCSYRYSYARGWMPPESFSLYEELKVPREKMQSWDPGTPKGREVFTATLDQVEKWLPLAEKAFAEGKPIPRQPRFPAPLEATDNNYLSNGELSLHYYGMVHPIKTFAIRGMVWSLGEGGCLEVNKYRFYLAALFKSWRAAWGQGDFPIYIELLASVGPKVDPADPEKPAPQKLDFWTRLREEQAASKTMVSNIELAYTCDVSDYVSDSRNRQDAGHRLAKVALANEYGLKQVFNGPVYKSSKIQAAKVTVEFDHASGGLMAGFKDGLAPVVETAGGKPLGFSLAGEDGKWHWADAQIEGQNVVLQSPQVPAPKWVRYGIAGNPSKCNLYNKAGLPALPFRTDGDQ